jgi:lipoyl(octanoyl) transferase
MKIEHLGRVDYLQTYEAMQKYVEQRQAEKTSDNATISSLQPAYLLPDQLLICEHYPVFTQGLAGKSEHILNAGNIPVVPSNRGGQVTYHGPGQLVAYPMIDLKAAG